MGRREGGGGEGAKLLSMAHAHDGWMDTRVQYERTAPKVSIILNNHFLITLRVCVRARSA